MIRKKTAEILLFTLCAAAAVITLFLAVTAVVFSKDVPNIFGKSVYLVKTDAFELIKSPSAVIAEKTAPELISPGNIVIFTIENGGKAIGEVRAKAESEGVTYMTVADENGKEHIVADSSIAAKAVKTSVFWGVVINFATKPAGLLVIAVLPCAAILAAEAIKPLIMKKQLEEKIAPVNKQDETPTFVPKKTAPPKPLNKAAAVAAYKSETEKSEKPNSQEQKATPPFASDFKPVKKPAKPEPPTSVKLAQTISLVKSEQEAVKNKTLTQTAAPIPPAPEETRNIEEILAAYATRKAKSGKGGK